MDEAGFPPGVYNVIQGGAEAANILMKHPDMKGVTFVGTTSIGKKVYQKCSENGKRSIAQLSAKNFIVVMPDADINATIAALLTSFFGNAGQRCLSGANLVITGNDDGFYKKFFNAFVEAASKIKVGYGLDESIQMGPMQSLDGKQRVLKYIDIGIKEKAKLVLDGRKPAIIGDYPDTCFINPTIFENVTPDMTIAKEEIFGAVASVMRAKDLNKVIQWINGGNYGNAASIFTSNGKAAREFQYQVECGNIGINIGVVAPMAFFPFSGMKDSFYGVLHGQGRDVIRFFTESKVVVQRWF